MRKVVFYTRVSTGRQEKEKTIEQQITTLEGIVKDPIIKIYKDENFSGTTTERPDLAQMMADAGSGFFNTLYIDAFDRLARPDSAQEEIIVGLLIRCGIKIFIQDKELEDTPDGRRYRSMLGVVAKEEVENTKRRTRRGRRTKAKEGKDVASIQSIGYKKIKKIGANNEIITSIVVDEEKKIVVEKIFKWFLQLKSCSAVALKLNKEGIPSPKGRRWNPVSVLNVLRNTSYIGIGYYNKTERVDAQKKRIKTEKITTENWEEMGISLIRNSKKTGLRTRSKDEEDSWIPIKRIPIIDKVAFEQAQKLLDLNKRISTRATKPFLLSGLLWCSCGGKMGGSSNKKSRYYRCNNYTNSFYSNKSVCKGNYIGVEKIEPLIWDFVLKILKNPYKVLIDKKRRMEDFKKNIISEEIVKIKKLVEKINKEKQRYLKLYGEGIISDDDLDKQVNQTNLRIENLNKEIAEKEEKMKIFNARIGVKEWLLNKSKEEKRKMIKELIEKHDKRVANMPEEEKREVLLSVIEKIVIDKKKGIAKVFGEIKLFKDQLDIYALERNLSNLFGERIKVYTLIVVPILNFLLEKEKNKEKLTMTIIESLQKKYAKSYNKLSEDKKKEAIKMFRNLIEILISIIEYDKMINENPNYLISNPLVLPIATHSGYVEIQTC